MTEAEREMIYEVNLIRSNPGSYLQHIRPMLEQAKKDLKLNGKGQKYYSLTYTTSTYSGVTEKRIDTVWHYYYDEEVKALTSLVAQLDTMKPLSILLPDSGIYLAARKHAADQDTHDWKLMHMGSDGSGPDDRVRKFSPKMKRGGENIAGRTGNDVTPKDIVIQLLIDSGIPGYGHRRTLLNPQWTHIACRGQFVNNRWNWWIQNFGIMGN